MKRGGILIVGAGGAGREVAEILTALGTPARGFLDRNPNALAGKNCAVPVLGDPAVWRPEPDEMYVCAVGVPGVRAVLTSTLRARGARFTSVIDPLARVGPSAQVGSGVVAYPGSFISSDAVVGDDVLLNFASLIAHDVVVEAGAIISPNVTLCGNVRVGEGAFLGAACCVVPGITIGAGAYICAGAVVIRDVPPGARVQGVPARERQVAVRIDG
jgi:sugar O-acyltransferase (sialic acid O-acetyltransferase NeuD family)